MKKWRALIGTFSLMGLSVLVVGFGTYGSDREGAGCHGKGFTAELTEEQREAIREKIDQMRSEGATRKEIHAAAGEMLEQYGIEVPEGWGKGRGRMGFFGNLTEEQREAIHAKITELRGKGATREQIHAAVRDMLQRYGIELPEHWGERRGPMGFLPELTEEQREAIREKIDQMRSEGATRKEIHAAVGDMLEEYGIQAPEHSRSSSETTLSPEGMVTSPTSWQRSYANPNPFYEHTSISYTLSAREDVQVQIYNATGQLVNSFEMGVQDPGSYSVQWDGTYENGAKVPAGVYLYRMEIGGEPETGRLVLLR